MYFDMDYKVFSICINTVLVSTNHVSIIHNFSWFDHVIYDKLQIFTGSNWLVSSKEDQYLIGWKKQKVQWLEN